MLYTRHMTVAWMLGYCLASLVWIGGLVSLSKTLSAQVNIEKERGHTQQGFSLSLDGSLNLIRGNVSLTQLGLGGKGQWIKGIHTALITGSLAYGERDEVAFLNQSFWHVRWTTMWWDHVGGELFAQLQEDAFRSLNLRQLYGGGARFAFLHHQNFTFASGLGYMFERENYQEQQGRSLELNHRATSYLSISYRLPSNQSVSLHNILYFQPNLIDIDDYRALNEFSLEIKLSENFKLVEALSMLYDSAPPPHVKRVDLKSMTTIRLEL